METLFLITNLMSLRPYLDSPNHYVLDGSLRLSVREWARWSDKEGVPMENPILCTPIDKRITTEDQCYIYPLGDEVRDRYNNGEYLHMVNQLYY